MVSSTVSYGSPEELDIIGISRGLSGKVRKYSPIFSPVSICFLLFVPADSARTVLILSLLSRVLPSRSMAYFLPVTAV